MIKTTPPAISMPQSGQNVYTCGYCALGMRATAASEQVESPLNAVPLGLLEGYEIKCSTISMMLVTSWAIVHIM
jgi:hypothetical protein